MENCLLGKNLEEIKQHYREDINRGGWFSFNSTKDQWKRGFAEKMLKHFFDIELIKKGFKDFSVNEEVLHTNNIDFSNIKDQSVLVIGGGPSTSYLTRDTALTYDYVFSCNHFFKNKILKDVKIDLALIGDEVDLKSKEFNDYLQKFQPIIGFEHSAKRSNYEILKFKKQYPRCFIYLTRYFSRLGYVPRAIILAALAGSSKIDYIGMDGFKKGAYTHSFEPNKPPPSFNQADMFKNQMKIFLKYLLKDIKIQKDSLNDLGASHPSNIYSGILEKIKNERH